MNAFPPPPPQSRPNVPPDISSRYASPNQIPAPEVSAAPDSQKYYQSKKSDPTLSRTQSPSANPRGAASDSSASRCTAPSFAGSPAARSPPNPSPHDAP